MATDKNTIKSWFEKDDRPTQAQFWAWIDSIWHKDEKIPITAIDDIEAILNEKADADAFDNHLTDVNAHAELFAEPNARLDDLEAKTDTENNWKTITGYSLNPATRVLTMNAGWEGIINGIDYTNAAAVPLPAINLAAAGYSRIDLIVFNTAGTFVIVPGTETINTPVKPAKPTNTLEATFVTVSDGVVNVPVIPKPKAPVTSVNGMRGEVVLNAINDLVTGGIYDFLSAEQGKVLKAQIDGINTLLTSNDVNLDTVQELVNAIKTVQTSLSTILVNDLTTGGTTKAATAETVKVLKGLIDALTTAVSNKVDKVAGERLINAGEITKLAGLGNIVTTIKPILSTALATQNVAGMVTYINALTPVLVVGGSEIVKYTTTDTGRAFQLNLRGRSFGVGQPAIVAADVLEVTEFLNKDLKLSNYPSTRNDGQLPTNKVLSTDANGNLKMYTIATAPPPYMEVLIPDSTLPSTTTNFTIKGAFFTPNMTVAIVGQTINYITFVSDNLIKVNVTTGATEGSYAVTLNNGLSATFNNALLIVLGTVYKPEPADWTGVSSFLNVSESGNAKITSFSSTIKEATWNKVFDNTKNWTFSFTFKLSPLGDTFSLHHGYHHVALYSTVDNAVAVKSSCDGSNSSGLSFRINPFIPSGSMLNVNFSGLMPETTLSYTCRNNVITMKSNGIEVGSFSGDVAVNLYLKIQLSYFDIINIKYIELAS